MRKMISGSALALATRDDLYLTVSVCMTQPVSAGVESQIRVQCNLPVRSLFRRGQPVKMKDALPSAVTSERKYCRLSLSASRPAWFDPVGAE